MCYVKAQTMPRVMVSIVSYHSGELLRTALESVVNHPLVSSVYVRDHGNGSDESIALASGANYVFDPKNPGFGAGHNATVLQHTDSADYVLILNPDCVMSPTAIDTAIKFADSNPQAAAFSGITTDSNEVIEQTTSFTPTPERLAARALGVKWFLRFKPVRSVASRTKLGNAYLHRGLDAPTKTNNLPGSALLLRMDAFVAVAGFDESFFLYGEDADLCRRLTDADFELWLLDTKWAVHTGSASFFDESSREVTAWAGSMQFATKWHSATGFALSMGASIVRAATWTVRYPRLAREAWAKMVFGPLQNRFNRTHTQSIQQ